MRYALLLLLSSALSAQAPPTFFPQWFDLKQYLQLTDAQYVKLLDNQTQYQRIVSNHQRRMGQLQNEIGIETARERPDPTELGTRYAEIEMICRQVGNEAKQLRTQNLSLLTEPQKTRLKALEDALKLMPIVSQAQSASLLEGPVPFGSVPTWVERSGDFAPPIGGRIDGIAGGPFFYPPGGCPARIQIPILPPPL